ncbi:hypothetical protein [Pseudomonas fluorescens]|uniref:Uncharacterized protein n=2 Tax=Pseudomonas fluorescens TaxID=294 RepID=A0A3M3XE40_PSEFL|nr:hypothetical protein [Pseudomonas fluorescens]MCI4605329.1 hypothetical protein [Pseudomonas fluorescens]PQB00166.1 hypothetical protein B0A76_14045 [Pseudomonas fluorescens]RFP96773.1 hypothetical protein D0N73_07695 [Pseudomonas fluorescens]RMO68111.1 hypothetical protein ALQ35_03910 [Pseudomonas fluorescens]TWR48667.1 hypothetical protein FIP59_07340 [Pseudomonas fluorescens]
MNIPNGYKLVPVEPTEHQMKIARSMTMQQEQIVGAEYRAMVKSAPTPPQPIYDEAKERERFEAYCAKVGLPIDTLPSGEYLIPATRFMSQGWHARAKAGEDE